MSIEALLQWLTQAIFVLIWLLTLVDYYHGRTPQRRDVTLMFGTLAVAVVAPWIFGLLGFTGPWLVAATSIVVIAQPYLLLRLVRYDRAVSRWIMGSALAGLIGSWILILVSPQPFPPVILMCLIGYFGLVEAYAGGMLIRGAFVATGDAKRRLGYAAGGTMMLAVLIGFAGLATILPDLAGILTPTSLVLGVACAVSYYLGFAPPGWTRDYWQAMRLAQQVGVFVIVATTVTALSTQGLMEAASERTAAVVVLLILLLSAASALLATKLFTPLRTLNDAAARFGRGDYSARVPSRGAADMRLLADQFNTMAAAVSAQAADLEERATLDEQRALELQGLLDLTECMPTDADVVTVAQRIVDYAGQIFSASAWAVLLPTDDGGLEVVAAGGLGAKERRGHRVVPGDGTAWRVFRSGELLAVDDASTDPNTGEFLHHIRSRLVVPLRYHDSVLGLLHLGSTSVGTFDTSHQALAKIVAAHAALALARAQLIQQLHVKNVALEAASRQKSEFLANMSHELRTPLNAINGFSRLMLIAEDDEFDAETRRSYLETVHQSGQHLLQLINDILDLSKVEAGKMELRLGAVDIAGLVSGVLSTVEPLAANKQITLTSDTEGACEIIADEGKVKQILYNLLSNAIKFTPNDGFVAVVARRVDYSIELLVADTGIGVAPEDQERMFDAFQQLDAGVDRQFEGTGLGLALTRRLVKLHGGTIGVESEVGHGTQFRILLPVGAVEAPGSDPRVVPSEASSGLAPVHLAEDESDRPLVLVVEDDPRSAALLKAYLRRGGFRAEEVGNGREAIEAARELQPTAITLDIMLPELDGWEVLRALKLDPHTQDIPVIVVSVADDQQLGYALGAVDYLVKPVDGEALLARLHRYTSTLNSQHPDVRVLVVDDDAATLELFRSMLVPDGYTVFCASGGAEGIELARRHRPDVMLLDLMMPEVTGFDVVAALREDPALQSITVLIVTAKDLTEEDKALLNGHIAAVFQKGGLAREELLTRLEDTVRRSCSPSRSSELVGAEGVGGRAA